MKRAALLGYYVVNADNEQVGWFKTLQSARAYAVKLSKTIGGIYYTKPEYAEASDAA